MDSTLHKIGFFTPDNRLDDDIFGCATLGIADNGHDTGDIGKAVWLPKLIEGIKLVGGYGDVLDNIKTAV